MDLRPKATAILSDRKNYVDENGWVPKQIFNMLFLPLISSVDAARARENRVAQNGNSEDDDMNTKIFRGRKIICRRVEYRMRDEIEFSPDRTMIRLKKRPVSGAKQSTLIEYNGVVKTIAEWGKATGIHPATIRSRLRNKWPMEKVFGTAGIRPSLSQV